MRITTKFMTILAFAAPLLFAGPANAETYKLLITGGDEILKIFLDNGVARRAGTDSGFTVFNVEMKEGQCVANLRLAFSDGAATIPVNGYNVCDEGGFGLTKTMARH